MRGFSKSAFGIFCLLAGGAFVSTGASAQTISGSTDIALRNGETLELGQSYLIGKNCRALTIATPEVEIMDGPPGVTVSMHEAMVMPRTYGCAKPVRGGKITISAKDVDDYSYSSLVLRFKYKTREGDRHYSHSYRVTLFP